MKQYRNNTINRAQSVVAYLLLGCQLLVSCGGNKTLLSIDPNFQSTKTVHEQQTKCTDDNQLKLDTQPATFIDGNSTISIVSSAKSSSIINRINGEAVTVTPFENLSIEEKTEMWQAFLDHGCDLISYPRYALSLRKISTKSIQYVKNSFKELVQQYHCNQHGTFESHKVASQLLIKYTDEHGDEMQTIKLEKLQNKTFVSRSIASELAASETYIRKKFDLIDNQIADLEASIKEGSLRLMNTVLLDNGVLTDRVRAYIDSQRYLRLHW